MKNNEHRFSDIPIGAIIIAFIFFWPAGLVMLLLRTFGDQGAQEAAKGGSRAYTPPPPIVGRGAVPPPPPQHVPPKPQQTGYQASAIPRQYRQSAPTGANSGAVPPVPPMPPRPVSNVQQNIQRPIIQPQGQPPMIPRQSIPQQSRPAPQSVPLPPRPVQQSVSQQPRPIQQPIPPQARPVPPPAKAAAPAVKQISTGGAVTAIVFGAIMSFIGFFVLTITGLNYISMGAAYLYDGAFLSSTVVFILLCVPGLALLVGGGKRRARVLRYRRYLTAMGSNKIVSIDRLAYIVSAPYQAVLRDLQAMIDSGIITGAYIDRDERDLVFGNPFEGQKKPKPAAAPGEAAPADEIRRINDLIADKEISAKLDRMEEITRRIFEYVDAKPDQANRIKNFTGYYLPMTMKILDAYVRFERQDVSGQNISSTMKDIEEILDTLVSGFENQLDSLFMDEAMDISSDITVLESMLQKEGLAGSAFMGITQSDKPLN